MECLAFGMHAHGTSPARGDGCKRVLRVVHPLACNVTVIRLRPKKPDIQLVRSIIMIQSVAVGVGGPHHHHHPPVIVPCTWLGVAQFAYSSRMTSTLTSAEGSVKSTPKSDHPRILPLKRDPSGKWTEERSTRSVSALPSVSMKHSLFFCASGDSSSHTYLHKRAREERRSE